MDFRQTLIYRFAQLSTAQRASLDKTLQPIGLFAGQIFVLFALWENDKQSQAELSDRLGISAPAVLKMVRSLSEADLVVARKSESDARINIVELTQMGREVRENAEAIWKMADDRFAENLTKGERAILGELIDKIRVGMDSAGDGEVD